MSLRKSAYSILRFVANSIMIVAITSESKIERRRSTSSSSAAAIAVVIILKTPRIIAKK